MIPELQARAYTDWTPIEPLEVWEWAALNVDFSRAPNYDTPIPGPYDPNFAPYTKQILEWLKDYDTRELWIRKCSRAGVSESILVFMRWIVACAPRPTYYLTADQLTTERFMESRIKRGMRTCPPAWEFHKRARETEHDVRYEHMDFRVSWPNAKGAFKQDGWAVIVADEFSTWKSFAADMLRKRAGTYRFHKIIGVSSPDPTRKGADGDPIILEYDSTDRCLWMMPDPSTGNRFAWEFGGAGKPYGLKWPDDAKDPETGDWNLERVRNESYYLTPDGTRIENGQRMEINHRGEWVATNPDAPTHIHGIWVVGPMVPFLDGDFGVMAYRFLEAKRKGLDALRTYFYENWADTGNMPNSTAVGDANLRGRELNYFREGRFWDSEKDGIPQIIVPENFSKGLILTADVQKYHLWWVSRWWMVTGERVECGLESWGNVANFDDLAGVCERAGASCVGVDIGYAGRFGETADYCADTGAIALKGEENMKTDIHLRDDMDPGEGRKARARASARYQMLTWNTEMFRSKLLAAMRGETPWSWWVYRMPEREYTRQVLSTHKVDGEWKTKKGHPQDHLFDCEVMQLVLARYDSLIQ